VGLELEVRELDAGATPEEAAACASYIAKYATKSTEVVGGLTHGLDADDLRALRVRDHVHRYVRCAWRLGGEQHLRGLRLRRWAHALGFRGTASPRAGATRQRSPRCAAPATTTSCAARTRTVAATP
jgi:hypothetical protein